MRLPIFFIITILAAGCATSSRISFLKIPPANVRDTTDVQRYEQKYGKYPGVFLTVENTVEHAGSQFDFGLFSSWSYYNIVHRKYIVLNPDDEWLTTFRLSTSDISDVENLYLQATYPNGRVQQWRQKDLVLTKDPDGYSRYKFIYPAVDKGTIIEEGYELSYSAMRHRPPLDYEIPLQYSAPCERIQFSYAYPDWWTISIKQSANSQAQAYTTAHDSLHSKDILATTVTDVPALVREPYAPYFKQVAQYLEFMIVKLHMGPVNFSLPATWKEYVKEYEPYLVDRNGFLSSKVADTTEYLVGRLTDPLQKFRAIISYLQNSVTPVQDWENRDFADILNQKKGDVYSITGLAYSMLKKARLAPSFLLIHSAEEGNFDSSYVSFGELSIPAVSVQIDGKPVIAFPYRKDLLLGQIQQDYQDQPAISMGEKGAYTLTKVSAGGNIDNKETEQYTIVITDDGSAKVKETRTFYGMWAYTVREMLNKVKVEDQEKFFKEMFAYEEEYTRFLSHTIEHQKDFQVPLRMEVEYSLENFVTMTPDEVLLRTSGLLSPVTIKYYLIEDKERNNPIDISFDEEIVKDVTIHFPQSWTVKALPAADSIENRFGYLRSDVELQNGELHVHQNRHLKKSFAPKEEINELIALMGRKKENAFPTIVFTKGGK